MRILVTGATGFVGAAMCRQLVAAGDDIVSLGRRPVDEKGVANWLIDDIDAVAAGNAPGGSSFDYVYHLAAAGVAPTDRAMGALIESNIRFGALLLQEIDARAFVFAGSCAEYAEKPDGRYVESDRLQQVDFYGASKAAGGLFHLAAAQSLGKPLAVLRLFHVYGPGEKTHRLTTSLFSALRKGECVALSPGEQIRDFIYVDDVGRAFDAAAAGLVSGKLKSGPYNICTGVGTKVKTVCKEIASLVGADENLLDFGGIELRHNELERIVGDGTAFRQAIDWRPVFSLHNGLRKLRDGLGLSETTGAVK